MSRRRLNARRQGLLILLIGTLGVVSYAAAMVSGYFGLTPASMPLHVILALAAVLLVLFCSAWYTLFVVGLYLTWRAQAQPEDRQQLQRALFGAAVRAALAALVCLASLGGVFSSGFLSFAGSLDEPLHQLASWLALGVAFGAVLVLWRQFQRVEQWLRSRPPAG